MRVKESQFDDLDNDALSPGQGLRLVVITFYNTSLAGRGAALGALAHRLQHLQHISKCRAYSVVYGLKN